MTPADVLLALVSAEVLLWLEGERLRYRAPVGALDEALRERVKASRKSLVALVRASGVLPADRALWPEGPAEDFEERAGILTYEAGMDPAAAEREAERLVRLAHTRAFVERAALVHHDPLPVEQAAGAAVARSPGGPSTRTG